MNTDLLADLIGKKHDILTQIRQLTQRQSEIVGVGDMSKLLSLLAAKQQLLTDLQQVEAQLDPFRDDDPETRVWRSPAARQQTRETAEHCDALLKEIMQLEKECEGQLVHRRDEAAAALQGVHTAVHARQAYLQAAPTVRGQLDVSSEI